MKFLSQEWFDKVKELRSEAGSLPMPEPFSNIVVNVTVNDGPEDTLKNLHLQGGEFAVGHDSSAVVTMTLPSDIVRKIFLEMDSEAGMQAFFAGQIQVEGDVSKLMELQTYQPGDEEKELIKKIVALTD